MTGAAVPCRLAEPDDLTGDTRAFMQWLQACRDPLAPVSLMSVIGDALLDPADRDEALAWLLQHAVPEALERAGQRPLIVLDIAAPGSQATFGDALCTNLAHRGARFRRYTLLPAPLRWLDVDWTHTHRTWPAITGAGIRPGSTPLNPDPETTLALFDASDWPNFRDVAWRGRQYRRLAAFLAEHVEYLAVLGSCRHGLAGCFSSDTLSWRHDPGRIPFPLRLSAPGLAPCPTRPIAQFVADRHRRQRNAFALSHEPDWFCAAQRALDEGNPLKCFDILKRANHEGLASTRLDYLQVQASALCSRPEAALRLFEVLRPAGDRPGEDWLALHGRLEKDIALAREPMDRSSMRRAASAYLLAYRQCRGSYSALNAATTLALAGHGATAQRLAVETLRLLTADGEPTDDELGAWYHHVSIAEAWLLLERSERARAALRHADQLLRTDIVRRARTLRQLHLLCTHLKLDASPCELLSLPGVALLAPSAVDSDIAAATSLNDGDHVFVVLDAPDDLEFVRQLLARHLAVHAVVRAPAPELLSFWEQYFGAHWHSELEAALPRLDALAVSAGFLENESGWCRARLWRTAEGLARLHARRLGCRWIEQPPPRCHAPLAPELELEQRRMVGLLFADFAGFRKLSDAALPAFWNELLADFADILAQHREAVLFSSTWGDALHVVTTDATSAARIACQVQALVEERRQWLDDPFAELDLRIAAHWAPAYVGYDPIRREQIYYGSQLSFAARMEPVTPPGSIYGSEAFVAELWIESPERFTLEYAGEVELAKHHGNVPLYSIQPA